MTPNEHEAYEKALRRIEICRMEGDSHLILTGFRLTCLPPEIGQLTALKGLYLDGNRLSMLPAEIGRLTSLKVLNLNVNQLNTLPPEIAQLTTLEHLYLSHNQLTTMSSRLCELTTLKQLNLANNRLSTLPTDVGRLWQLTRLNLRGNQLGTVPREIGRLMRLTLLDLSSNQLTLLPPEIGQLTELRELLINFNSLVALPPEIAKLSYLIELTPAPNPLLEPPHSICFQGIRAIQRYFADKARSGTEVSWRSKLMLVGQGRVGKTELRHRLMKREHGKATSTEVVEIETVPLPHPQQPGVTMELRCWDFGGQDIYHATHQFFLTGRSLFVFCFEAGKDWEAGRPYYWLDKIAAVAPDAPVIIVATKCDERPAPALPWEDLKKRYPQLVGDGCFNITTREKNRKDQPGDGMTGLIACLQTVAADRIKLPLMGEELPKSWVKGMDAVAKHPHEHFLKRADFCQLLQRAGVPEESLHTVAVMLRDLGEILYYSEDKDAALHDWVIIKPTWVTRAAARILESAEVEKSKGILTQREMSLAWIDYSEAMHPVLLDLLEKYDLTYKIPDDAQERSLVVEKLPKSEEEAPSVWQTLKPAPGKRNREMKMTFHLGSMQAGIPTWFIARKHYYTLKLHWLYGVYFADSRIAPRHVALVRASTDPKRPEVELTVRGLFPQTFFAVMKEGLEASIRDRYPRLIEKETIPCSCQDEVAGENRCGHKWEVHPLEEMFQENVPAVRCQKKPFKEVTIRELLSGYDDPVSSMQVDLEKMEQRIREDIHGIGETLDDVAALVRQSFQYLYDDLQQREESHCPNYFVLWKAEKGKPFHVPMRLALVCQHPGHEHAACRAADAYKIDALNEHLRKAAPLLKRVATVLKYAKLTGLSPLKELDKELGEAVGDLQEGINEMRDDFERISAKGEAPELLARDIEGTGKLQEKRLAGAALREFRALLDKLDPQHGWHGLEKKKSNQTGEFLWVCKEHAALSDYRR